mmetsp:Transcript_14230/g.41490  ORF Transcript_14230/g.41490 Transcript_14230/m.41490 type:complete len:138 (-) Transcript_14230:204-617(-)|eukprot:152135-Chlamydomonas_euryale.AAC.1
MLYFFTGVEFVCSQCLCVDPAIKSQCYNCLSWARPGNSDGATCTACSSLQTNAALGGAASAEQCFDCVVNMDGVCTQPNSCFSPPTVTASGAPYTTDLAEIAICWACMARHMMYDWGTGECGEHVPFAQYRSFKLPP